MVHHFPFDPRTVLGVSPEASPEEVHEAFREKSKKHHPDLGGDEWAFRIVARAYEVLKSTGDSPAAGPPPPPTPPSWTGPAPSSAFFTQGSFPFGAGTTAGAAPAEAHERPEPPEGEPPPRAEAPGVFQTVDVELIWIRYDMARKPAAEGPAEGATLSVCMVVSWPRRSLVSRTAEYANLGETLHYVIEAFRGVERAGSLAARSRIEDGQFVGWLSFPDVVAAQAGFLALRDDLGRRDLIVQLQTRDELIPANWAD